MYLNIFCILGPIFHIAGFNAKKISILIDYTLVTGPEAERKNVVYNLVALSL